MGENLYKEDFIKFGDCTYWQRGPVSVLETSTLGLELGRGRGSLLLYLYTKPRGCLGQASCPNHPCSSVPILKCCVTHSKLRRDVAFLKGHSTLISWLVRGSARAWTQASELGVTSSALHCSAVGHHCSAV